jgi:hypothetical protein
MAMNITLKIIRRRSTRKMAKRLTARILKMISRVMMTVMEIVMKVHRKRPHVVHGVLVHVHEDIGQA